MDLHAQKAELRNEIRRRRVKLANRVSRSERIQTSVWNLPQLPTARCVAVYVGHRSEVATDDLISQLLEAGKRVFVPWCDGDELQLFRLEAVSELAAGAFGIPEPPPKLRQLPERSGLPGEMDIVLVPGLAFDRNGYRLGQGKGYYDRLLNDASDRCLLIGLAYDIQLIEQVPFEAHDVRLDMLVTESEVIDFRA